MKIFENALFIIDAGKIYATDNLIVAICGVYIAICLVSLLAALLPKLMSLVFRFAKWCINKIPKKERKN